MKSIESEVKKVTKLALKIPLILTCIKLKKTWPPLMDLLQLDCRRINGIIPRLLNRDKLKIN